ncbi:GNAT family N-acetyltransferase [Demequina sp. NBRC 110054]|uniref:GNAT family N-acetyltransferase n=1 Tax=Demequina sp. NBRC 110054 TaxID=1570343 RepID=UPI001F1B9CF4|nr:GNAT family N-acetyltransferase [Demequina sp. NBRC 110054]
MSEPFATFVAMLAEVLNENVVRTERLTLSRPSWTDVDQVHALMCDPSGWTHLPSGRHGDRAQTEQLVCAWLLGWDTYGLGVSVVRRRGSAEMLGYVGCSVRDDALWNLGHRLSPSAQGQGFAVEAAAAAIARASEVRPTLPSVAVMLEHNHASVGVARAVGLTLVARGGDAGNPDRDAVRLVYADRALTERQREAAMS